MDNSGRKVDFGFEKVAWDEKAQRVRSVFASVAGKYDVMNDLLSSRAAGLSQLVFGLILIAVILWQPRGFITALNSLRARLPRKEAP